jgi:phosphohistidine phosphatase
MDLYFLRHAEAEEQDLGESDADRELTRKGRDQAQRAADWLAKRQIKLDVVLTSPLLRAVQTAEPVAATLKVELEEDDRLSGGRLTPRSLRSLWEDSGRPASVLLVGHEPDFSTLITDLTGEPVEMKKAALALVQGAEIAEEEMELVWVVPSKLQD